MFIESSLALCESNVGEFSQARVYFLLGKHSTNPGREQLLQEQFNAQFVEAVWKEKDQLWVEESASLSPYALTKNQLRLIELEGKFIAGWDHPEVCESAERVAREALALPPQEARALKHQFVVETFPLRQRFLSLRIQKYIKENEGRLFILAGEHHACTKDPRFEPHAQKLLQELRDEDIPFSVFLFKQPKGIEEEKSFSFFHSIKTYVESLWPKKDS